MITQPRKYVNLILVALLAVGLWTARASAAAPAGVTMQVEAHYSGHFKFGEWLPLRVTLANDGPAVRADVRADVTEASGQITYVAPVELPTGARKQLTLYVQPPSFARAVRVRLIEGQTELARQNVAVTVERNVNYIVGVIAPRMEPFAVLGGLTLNPQAADVQFANVPRPVVVLPVQLSDIPDRAEGLRVLDALIISGVDTSGLGADQGRALQGWVEQGGRLIVGGGAGAARTLAGLPAGLAKDLLAPGITADLQTLPALADFAEQEIRVPGPFAVTWPAARRDALIEQDGLALAVERRLGEGYINYVALDLAGSPFDAWAGAVRFWEKLLTPGSAYPLNLPPDVSPRLMHASSLYYALQNLPALELPSIRWLGGLLIVYILLVGPVNYLILRRLRKLEWGWVTIPALTVMFSVGAFALGFNLRGSDVIVNQISILTFHANGTAAPMQTCVGIFSPARRAYTVNVPDRALLTPLSPDINPWGGGGMLAAGALDIVQSDPAQVRGLQVDQWAMQAFQVESSAPEGWTIESALTLDGERIRGTLVNRTGETLLDATLVYGNRYARLGNLAAGSSLSLDHVLQNPSNTPFPYFLYENIWQNAGPQGPPRELQVQQQLLDSQWGGMKEPTQPPVRPTLIAWLKASPLEVHVADTRWTTQQMGMVIAELAIAYPPGPVRVSPAILTARLVQAEGNAYTCSSSPNQLAINEGAATLEFQLPYELRNLSVSRMALLIYASGGNLPRIEFYTRDGEWVTLESPQPLHTELTQPARFLLPGGLVRVRLSSNTVLGDCPTYELEMEGTIE